MSEIPEDIVNRAREFQAMSDADPHAYSEFDIAVLAILAERTRCIEAFRCFDYDYAVNFIKSGSVIVDRK